MFSSTRHFRVLALAVLRHRQVSELLEDHHQPGLVLTSVELQIASYGKGPEGHIDVGISSILLVFGLGVTSRSPIIPQSLLGPLIANFLQKLAARWPEWDLSLWNAGYRNCEEQKRMIVPTVCSSRRRLRSSLCWEAFMKGAGGAVAH